MGYHSVRLRRSSVLGFALLLVAAVVGAVVLTGQQQLALPAWSLFNKGIPGGEEQQRIEFLQKNGWEAELPAVATSSMRRCSRPRALTWINCGAKPPRNTPTTSPIIPKRIMW